MTIYTGLIKYHRDPGGNACKDTVSDKAACTDEIDGTTYCRRSIKLNFLCNNEISDIYVEMVKLAPPHTSMAPALIYNHKGREHRSAVGKQLCLLVCRGDRVRTLW